MKKVIFLGVLGLASTLSYSYARQSPTSPLKAAEYRPTLVKPVAAECTPSQSPGDDCPCDCCYDCQDGWSTSCAACNRRN